MFIDIAGKEKAQWVKDTLISKEELKFDGIYTYNCDQVSSTTKISIEQIVQDFVIIDYKERKEEIEEVCVIQGIKFE